MAEGFRRARGEIIIQLDSDSYIVPGTFRKIIEPFRNSRVGAVCAHADPANPDENTLTRMQAAYYFFSFRLLKAAESTFLRVFCCSGCSSAYRRDIVLPILDQWLGEKFLGLPTTWGDDRALTNRNLLPKNAWIGVKSKVENLADGTVRITLYMDNGKTGSWTTLLKVIDDGRTYGGAAIMSEGHAGIHTDFMDVEFDDFRITAP
jgi:hypothetical protein